MHIFALGGVLCCYHCMFFHSSSLFLQKGFKSKPLRWSLIDEFKKDILGKKKNHNKAGSFPKHPPQPHQATQCAEWKRNMMMSENWTKTILTVMWWNLFASFTALISKKRSKEKRNNKNVWLLSLLPISHSFAVALPTHFRMTSVRFPLGFTACWFGTIYSPDHLGSRFIRNVAPVRQQRH